jgi:hypothetical protein
VTAGEIHDGRFSFMRDINQPLRMLVGTGSQITVLKRNCIPDNIPTNTNRKCEIAGITAGSIETLGNAELAFHDCSYRYQVTPEEIQLNEDRLIGRDI